MTRRRIYKHRITWNRIAIEVVFDPDWLGNAGDAPREAVAHLQLRSIKPQGAPLPVSETGYRSEFPLAASVIDAGGPLVYARKWLEAEAATRRWKEVEDAARQYTLL